MTQSDAVEEVLITGEPSTLLDDDTRRSIDDYFEVDSTDGDNSFIV